MNNAATSKEEIIAACRDIAEADGLGAVNMRAVASRCGVALGCIYNYYPSKAALLSALVGDIWSGIFGDADSRPKADVTLCAKWIFDRVKAGSDRFPSFLSVHPSGFAGEEKADGRGAMTDFRSGMAGWLKEALSADPAADMSVFSESFTPDDFANFVLENIIAALSNRKENCGTLLKVIDLAIKGGK